jgi:hypothetical protein
MATHPWLRRLGLPGTPHQARRSRRKPSPRVRPRIEVLEDRTLPAPLPVRAVWVDTPAVTNYITEPNLRQNLVAQCAASGINTMYISVYQSTANSTGHLMYDATDLAGLISLAHAQGIQVWADYGAPDWPALYAAQGSGSFPMQRVADVVAYNNAEPTARFDGVMLDVEYNPSYDAASNEPESTFLSQLVPFYRASQNLLGPANIPLGAAISAFWNPNTDPSVSQPVYQQIIYLGLNQIVVMGYRDFAGSTTEGDGIIGLDQDEITYAASSGSNTAIIAGLETQNITPSDQTFYSDGNAAMTSVMQTVAGHFGSTLGGFAIDAYGAAYLSGQPGWPRNNAYVVTNTLDDGSTGSLRWAITQVNNDANDSAAQPDLIAFNINAPGVQTIAVGSSPAYPGQALPSISQPVVIDGYTQAGSSPNTLTVGDNAAINIVLDGTQAVLIGGAAAGLVIDGGSSTVEGLTVQNFHWEIAVGSNNNLVVGSNLQVPNVTIFGMSRGVQVIGSDNTIGGTSPAARNVIGISGELGVGIQISFSLSQGNLVEGNYIGTDATGSVAVTPIRGYGVWVAEGSDNTIGGTSAAARNVISGWGLADVALGGCTGNLVEGNYLGTNATGSGGLAGPHGPTDSVVLLYDGASGNTIGGAALGAGNLILGGFTGVSVGAVGPVASNNNAISGNIITSNSGDGVDIENGTGISILGNSIYGNGGLGIDDVANNQGSNANGSNVGGGLFNLGTAFVDTNWPGGPFTGTNNATFSNLTLTQTGSTLTYSGTLSNGLPKTRYLVTLDANDSDGVYWGSDYTYLTTDSSGQVQFAVNFPAPWPSGTAPGAPSATASPPHSLGNHEQNFPMLTSATSSGSGVTISGTFNSTPGDTFRLEFFSNPQADPSGYGQGQMYLGSAQVTTGADGNAASSPDGSAIINSDGSFTVTLPTPVLAGQGYLTATATDVTSGAVGYGDTSEFSPDLIVPATSLAPVTSQNLQALLNYVGPAGGSTAVALQAADSNQADAVLAAVNGLAPQPAPGATVTLDLAPGAYTDMTASPPAGVTLVITGNGTTTTIVGQSPALTVTSGKVIVTGVALSTATDAPTILATGGNLTLRNDIVQESTGFNDPAISVTGGALDLGTTTDPGNNILNVNGAGTFLRNTTAHPVAAVGDTFEMAVTTNSSLMLIGINPPPLTGVVNGTPFTGTINYPTGFGSSVTVTLSTAATSASAVGQYPISSQLSAPNDGNSYVINPGSSTTGTMYVVSVGADPSGTGGKAVAFWDNKGNAKLITAADLSSLDALNLVNQGGAGFDPKAVAQLEAWLSISPNASTSYQLAVQLAVLDLNVLDGYVQTTDLLYAGGLLPYAVVDNIAGLTSGGFIDVQSLMQAANTVLGQVSPGTQPSSAIQAYEAALIQVLQSVNSNSDFVSQDLLWSLTGTFV